MHWQWLKTENCDGYDVVTEWTYDSECLTTDLEPEVAATVACAIGVRVNIRVVGALLGSDSIWNVLCTETCDPEVVAAQCVLDNDMLSEAMAEAIAAQASVALAKLA